MLQLVLFMSAWMGCYFHPPFAQSMTKSANVLAGLELNHVCMRVSLVIVEHYRTLNVACSTVHSSLPTSMPRWAHAHGSSNCDLEGSSKTSIRIAILKCCTDPQWNCWLLPHENVMRLDEIHIMFWAAVCSPVRVNVSLCALFGCEIPSHPVFMLRIMYASPYMRSLLKGLDGKEEDEIEEPKKIKAATRQKTIRRGSQTSNYSRVFSVPVSTGFLSISGRFHQFEASAPEMPRVPGLQYFRRKQMWNSSLIVVNCEVISFNTLVIWCYMYIYSIYISYSQLYRPTLGFQGSI